MIQTSCSQIPRLASASLLLGLIVLVSFAPAASAGQFAQQSVYFGVPRTQVVSGLDFEAACRVTANYEGIDLLDGGSGDSFIGVGPGPCAITVFVLGIPISLPVLNSTPLGRFSFYIPGVAGLTFGLADVSIDLVTGLFADYTGSSTVLSPNPTGMSWTTWGSKVLTMGAQSGIEGNTLFVTAPYTLSMTFGVGVSVYALGIRLFYVDLASLGSFQGTPTVPIPVSIDLRPTHVTVTGGWAPSATSVQVNWTRNTDTDFDSYLVRVANNESSYTFALDSAETTSLRFPASPDRQYSVTVTVVDRAGQTSTSGAVSVRTPPPPASSVSPTGTADATASILMVIVAFAAGFGLAWVLRGRQKRV